MTSRLWQMWGEWEIRALLLGSLSLQVFLLFTGGIRKRNVASWLHLLLWLAYLLADSIAVFALGYLSQSQKLCHVDGRDDELHLLVFWAPFLILHLGGQDTITAFAIEDNELWLRHLLSLVWQIALALYVYWKSRPSAAGLLAPALVMFVSGVVKYAERTWALKSASMSSLRSSMLTRPDPGPNYAKFMEEYHSSKEAGLHAEIVIVPERPPGGDNHVPEELVEYGELLVKAHMFFHTFRRLFVDLILSFKDRIDSLAFFRRLTRDQAYKVVEVELQLMYESLHSKSSVIHGPSGRYLRIFTLTAPILSLIVFSRTDKTGYKEADIAVSYVLLVGAIFLEIYGFLLMVISLWSYADLRQQDRCLPAARIVFRAVRYFSPEERPRWSNQMAQYNLISYCVKDKSTWFTRRVLENLEWDYNIRAKTMWDSLWYTNRIDVSLVLKQLAFRQLKDKANSTADPMSYRRFGDHRGQWILQRKGCYQELRWSVDVELDESIILWHIATDLCFHDTHDDGGGGDDKDWFGGRSCSDSGAADVDDIRLSDLSSTSQLATASREMSNYMLFLLVMRPFMLTASIGQIRFGDTCAEAKSFFLRGGNPPRTEWQAAKALAAVRTDIDPRQVKGDRSKSVLFDACRLAEQLQALEERKRWRLVAGVWVEMLCYAAGKCSGNFHAKQLSQGGELLTVLWLLMAHFGMGDQYRVEVGHARAKLIVAS